MDRELRKFYERQIQEYSLLKRQYDRQQLIIEVLLTNKMETFMKEAIKDFIHNEKDKLDT
jgi:hypothetical protein